MSTVNWGWVLLGTGAAVIGGVLLYSKRASASTNGTLPAPMTNLQLTPTIAATPTEVITTAPDGSATTVVETPSAPAPEPPAVTPPPPAPPGSPAPAATTAPPPPASPVHLSMVDRLRSSAAARQLFGFQSWMYSTGFTGALPDGGMGPVTAGLIKEINRQSGDRQPTSGVFRGASTLTRFALVNTNRLSPLGGAPPAAGSELILRPRRIPTLIPDDVAGSISGTMSHLYGGWNPIFMQTSATPW